MAQSKGVTLTRMNRRSRLNMAGPGRPGPQSSLTPSVRDEIAKRIAVGATIESAAQSIGMTRRVIQKWLAVGRDAEALRETGKRLTTRQSECLLLLEAEQRARAENEIRLLTIAQRGAQEDPRLALALLERLYPERYAPQGRGSKARPNAGRPTGATSAPDRPARPGIMWRDGVTP